MRRREGEVREGLRGGVDQGDERRSLRPRLTCGEVLISLQEGNGRGSPGRFLSAITGRRCRLSQPLALQAAAWR
jgi:hypothetical protein